MKRRIVQFLLICLCFNFAVSFLEHQPAAADSTVDSTYVVEKSYFEFKKNAKKNVVETFRVSEDAYSSDTPVNCQNLCFLVKIICICAKKTLYYTGRTERFNVKETTLEIFVNKYCFSLLFSR